MGFHNICCHRAGFVFLPVDKRGCTGNGHSFIKHIMIKTEATLEISSRPMYPNNPLECYKW